MKTDHVHSVWLLLAIFIFWGWTSTAQPLYTPIQLQKAYAAGTRSADGKPGARYWQNRADYELRITVLPPDNRISGRATIVYTNNSPDTLRRLQFKLAQNTHIATAVRADNVDRDWLNDGFLVDSFAIDGRPVAWKNESVNYSGNPTNHSVSLSKPLFPGAKATVYISWHYDLHRSTDNVREGVVDSTSFFLAYFYPRIAVYDDLLGWDPTQLNEQTEFYNDYGNYDLWVETPANYVVWASGELQNAAEVLAPTYAQRLREAEGKATVTQIVNKADLARGGITANKRRLNWHFRAVNVTDVAFGLSDHFLWDAVMARANDEGSRKALVQTAYHPNSADYYEMAAISQRAVEFFSVHMPGYPFPYNRLTAFNGHSQMEYPMIINDQTLDNPDDVITLATHEIAHQYMPFFVGTNESRHAWMDEGWATFFEYFASTKAFKLNEPATATFPGYYQRAVRQNPGAHLDVPMYSPSDQLWPGAYSFNSYGKPAAAYTALYQVLGEDTFKRCLHAYIDRWNGKHPGPHDFFNTFNDVSGQDLNWFWQRWWFDYNTVDLRLDNVTIKDNSFSITISNPGGKPVSIKLQLTYPDGKTQLLEYPPAVWKTQSTFTIQVASDRPIVAARLIDDLFFDVNRGNNELSK